MSSTRLRRTLTTVFVVIFALLAESAFATHFRYGYVFWERDLSYVSADPNMVKIDVTFETGGRWTYTAWNQATSQGITPAVCTAGGAVCCTGVISNFASSTYTSLSCPPVNDLVNFAGGVTSGIALVGTGPVTVVSKHGVTLTSPIVFSGPLTATNIYAIPPGATANLPMDVIVTQVVPAQDTFYGRFRFSIVMDKRNPLRMIWGNSNRLSELLDGNNDIPWRLESIIDLTGANANLTKSPKSASSTVVNVSTGQNNIIDIPTVAFDNQVNTFRLATSQESGLASPQPLAPSTFSLDANTGRIIFHPRTNGLYAVQVIVSSKNVLTGAITESVPLDFMFNAVAGGTYAETLATGDGQTTYTATVAQPLSYTIRSTTTPANAAYNVTINHGVLPTGATFTQPNCAANAVCVGTFNWTPSVTSTPAVVCYSSSLTNGQVLVTTSAQTCVTVNINPLETSLEAFPASGAAGGGPLALSAKLTRVLDGAALPGRTINFSFPGSPNNPPWIGTASGITNAQGIATATVFSTTPASAPYEATFSAIAGELLAASSGTNVISVKAANTSLNQPTVSSNPLPSVGFPLPISAVLNRIYTDGGIYGVGATLDFSLTAPGGAVSTAPSTPTGLNGVGTATLPAPAIVGTYTTQASFAGNDSLFGGVTSSSLNFQVYQRTQLTQSAGIGYQNIASPVSATLVAIPSNTPIAGQTVTFTAAGATTQTAVTDANGVATANLTFATTGAKTVTATFTPAGAMVNRNGLIAAETSAATATIQVATPTTLTISPATGVAGAATTLTAHLQTTSGAAPVQGSTVHFVVGANSVDAVTDAAGDATGTLVLAAAGSFASTASARAIGTYAPASASSTVTINKAATALSSLGIGSVQYVGQTMQVATTLTRTDAPAGAVSGATVTFTLVGLASNPGGATTSSINVTTDAAGVAQANIPVNLRGQFTLTASYAGSAGLLASLRAADVTVLQRTTLLVNVAHGFAGAATTISASLQMVPDGQPLPGQTVSFGFAGIVPTTAAVTDSNGVAQTTTTFPSAGTFAASASFNNLAGFFADANGNQLPTTSDSSVDVAIAITQLDGLVVNPVQFIGDLTAFTTTLTRVSSPAGFVSGAPVNFQLSSPSSSSVGFRTVNTDANGVAVATFPFNGRGPLKIAATFNGDAGLAPASKLATFNVYQKTQITVADANANAGHPVQLQATLASMPGSGVVPGQMVTFSFGGVIPDQSAITDASSVASVTVTFPSAGWFPVTASFANAAGFFANRDGVVAAESATGNVTVINTAPTIIDLPNVNAPATSAGGRVVNFMSTGNDAEDGALTPVCTAASGLFPIGTTTVTCTVTDTAGASASDSFTITITNNAPTFTTPANISLPATSAAGRVVTFTATGDDLEDGTLHADCEAQSGNTFAIGTTNVLCTVTDVAGASASGSFSITITNTAPTIVDLPDVSASATSAAGRMVTFTSSGSDAEDGVLTPLCTASSGATFPIGTTHVTCTVTDVAGASASDSFTITITNNAPTFTAPANISLPATGPNGRAVTFSALGNDVEDGPLTADCQAQSGNTFPIGATMMNCTVTDAAGASASDSFSITITNTAPTIVDLPNITASATSAGGRVVTFTSTGNDAEDGALTPTCTAPSGGTFPIGTTSVTCSVTDIAGATASDSFTITITNNAPTFTAPASISLPATGPNGRAVTFSALGNDVEDGTLTADCQAQSGNTFPIGATNIACTVTDIAGATASGSFTITITNTAPTIVDLPNLSGEATGASGRAFTFTSTGNDAEDGTKTPVCTANSGTFPIGTTTVSCTVTDVAGYTATDAFTITVVDTTAPVLTLPTIAPAFATSAAGRAVSYTTSALDTVDGSTAVTCSPLSGSTFPIATTTVNCSTSDSRGNTRTGSFSVSITNTAPTIVDLPNLSGEATGASGRAFTFTSTGNDAEDGTKTPVCSAASGTFPIGVTNVTCTVTDVAGATASDSFTITVVDTTAPAVTAASITVQQTSPAGAIGVFAFSATDIVDGALTPTCTPASGTTFPRGVTTVTCSKTDAHGNIGSATSTVTVIDTIKPVVTYTGNAGTYAADQIINITCAATDSGSGVATTTCANVNGPAYSFAVGVNTRSASATDVAGNTNSASISFTVTVPPAALGNVINSLVTSPSVAATLNQTLNLATGAPNATARASHLNKMIKDINKEIGKSITAAQAATLINLINQLY